MKRSEFIKWLGLGGAGVAASGLFGFFRRGSGPVDELCAPSQATGHAAHVTDTGSSSGGYLALGDDGVGAGSGILERAGNSYGSMVHPPHGLDRAWLQAFERPLETKAGPEVLSEPHAALPGYHPPRKSPRSIAVDTFDRPLNVAAGLTFNAWTFNNTVPGPVIRATLGETLDIKYRNLTVLPHSLHFHGTHDINHDGWEPIPPGGETTYTIEAGPVGLHPYHCHVPPLDVHMAKGLFGALIVDPPGGRPPAHEAVLILHGYDLRDRGVNDIVCWNGIAGFYDRFPIRVRVNELVRLYVVNMLEYEPIASFHMHAQTFDVYRTGTRLTPDDHTDVVTLGQTERVILEFRLPKRGRYMFHPHQTKLASKGSMGWIVAV